MNINDAMNQMRLNGYITSTLSNSTILAACGVDGSDGGGSDGGSSINKLDVPYNFQLNGGQVSHYYGFQPQSQDIEETIEEYNAFLEETATTLGITTSQLNDIINGNVDRLVSHCTQEVEGDSLNFTMMSKLDDVQYCTNTYAAPQTPAPGITITGQYGLNTTYRGLFLGMTGGDTVEPLYTSNITAAVGAAIVEGYETPIVTNCSISFGLRPIGA